MPFRRYTHSQLLSLRTSLLAIRPESLLYIPPHIPSSSERLAGVTCCYTVPRSSPPTWSVIAPTLHEKREVPSASDRWIRGLGWGEGMEWGAFEKLARVKWKDDGVKELLFKARTSAMSRLEALPGEILGLILGTMERRDVVGVGCCSRTLWNWMVDFIKGDIRVGVGKWAGVPLYCGMAGGQKVYGERLAWMGDDVEKQRDVEKGNEDEKWGAVLAACAEDLPVEVGMISRCLRVPRVSERWVLRNLTTQEVVKVWLGRDLGSVDEMAELSFPSCVRVDGKPRLSLDAALLRMISWGERGRKKIRGEWARHCFDAVPSADCEIGTEWVDVTADVGQ